LGWDLILLNILIGSLVVVYTVTGGTRAVNITQKQQMGVIFGGMFLAFLMLLNFLPLEVGLSEALSIAGAQDKMNILDFSFDFNNRYTFWSGIIGGSFLALSYFGTDQSQVQRYLSGRSIRQSQMGLIMNGMLKVPMQFFILLIGVLVFVFYQFNPSPLNFNPTNQRIVLESAYADEYRALDEEKDVLMGQIQTLQIEFIETPDPEKQAALKSELSALNQQQLGLREEARALITAADKNAQTNDKDYVFIHFILNQLPIGLIGLLLAVILSAAMSSTASEINALGATTAVDLYQRHRPGRSEKHYLKITRYFTLVWGVIAILVACTAPLFDNLIQLVNIIGSIFYGNILGVFLAAFFLKSIRGSSIFLAAIINQAFVITLFLLDLSGVIKLPYLWLNVIGCAAVIAIALIIQFLQRAKL